MRTMSGKCTIVSQERYIENENSRGIRAIKKKYSIKLTAERISSLSLHPAIQPFTGKKNCYGGGCGCVD